MESKFTFASTQIYLFIVDDPKNYPILDSNGNMIQTMSFVVCCTNSVVYRFV